MPRSSARLSLRVSISSSRSAPMMPLRAASTGMRLRARAVSITAAGGRVDDGGDAARLCVQQFASAHARSLRLRRFDSVFRPAASVAHAARRAVPASSRFANAAPSAPSEQHATRSTRRARFGQGYPGGRCSRPSWGCRISPPATCCAPRSRPARRSASQAKAVMEAGTGLRRHRARHARGTPRASPTRQAASSSTAIRATSRSARRWKRCWRASASRSTSRSSSTCRTN